MIVINYELTKVLSFFCELGCYVNRNIFMCAKISEKLSEIGEKTAQPLTKLERCWVHFHPQRDMASAGHRKRTETDSFGV
jgi:hypothetical protein